MPYDLSAIERGFGECDVEWPQNSGQTILIRYRADLNNRALIAMKRVMVGVLTLDGLDAFPGRGGDHRRGDPRAAACRPGRAGG
jgi:hypothetical protein